MAIDAIILFFPCSLNGGELFDYVIAKEYLDENEATYYMRQILGALEFCHKKNIVHLDLKVTSHSPFFGPSH